MHVAQHFHHFIEGNGFKGLDHFQPFSHRKLRRLVFQPFQEIARNVPHIDFFEAANFLFPFHIFHIRLPLSFVLLSAVTIGVLVGSFVFLESI